MYKLLIIFSVLLLASAARAQDSANLSSVYFDQPQVLLKAGVKNVTCIFKDSRHLMWIGTDNGIFRYDGTSTVYQRHLPGDTSSIPGNYIVSITEDKNGNIWLGTKAGVARMNPYNLKCHIYRKELKNLDANFDNKVFISDNGKIWTGNIDGLFLLDRGIDQFRNVWKNELEGKPASAYVTTIIQWQQDTLAFGTFHDLVLINIKSFGFRRIDPLNRGQLVTRLMKDDRHRLWIGTWGGGCLVSDPTLAVFQQYQWEKDRPLMEDNVVFSLAETNSGTGTDIWIGAQSKIIKLSIEENETPVSFREAQVFPIPQNATRNAALNCLMADDENYIWMGGTEIEKFPAGKSRFQDLPFELTGSVQNIQSFSLDHNSFLAVSTWHSMHGLLLIDEKKGISKRISSIAPGDPYGVDISGLARDKYNRLWLSSLAGVYILNDKFKIIQDLSKPSNEQDALSGRKTDDILINHDTVWVACYRKGIDLYDLDFHKLKHFIPGDGSGLMDDLMARIYKDSRGRIWICGDNYFYQYLPSSVSFKKYDLSVEHTIYAPADVAELPDGNLVIATEIGLIYLNTATEAFYKITTPLLDKEEAVLSVAVDAAGDVWYLTSAHLVRYEVKTKKFTLFGEEDGLDANGLEFIRSFNGRELLMAENGKLVQFNPGNWQKKVASPQLLMNVIQVNDSIWKPAKPLKELHLNYDQNRIYFEFDGVTYVKPEQNEYAYMLTGIDKDWIYSNKNFASYANLSPGHYSFHVKAANFMGDWSGERIIELFIRPPWWKTWWFISLLVLVLGVILISFIRYISQRNLRMKILKLEKEQAIEKERNRIARDVHDDLGSGLTKIAILSEVAKTQLRQEQLVSAQLEKISNSSRELVDNLQDIIWVLNPQNDSLDNLASYIREYALKFFEATDVRLQFAYPRQIPTVKLSEEQRRNIFLVIKETLNNMAKYSGAGNIVIRLLIEGNCIIIEMGDDGKGFEPSAKRPFANGLANMKTRMEQVNGTFEIQSGTGKGTHTRITIPV